MKRAATLLIVLSGSVPAFSSQEVSTSAAIGCTTFYRDVDGDGWGVAGDSFCISQPTYPYTAFQVGDCDDDDPAVRPGAIEWCDGVDNDCDGQTDEVGAFGCTTYYRDLDGDGFGDPGAYL